jgi:hypothetical protein
VAGSWVPAYVPRDIDGELWECLARGGFVVLVAPAGREALPAAVGKAAETRTGVLWLNDLERFLGSGGLTRTQVTRLLSGGGHPGCDADVHLNAMAAEGLVPAA